DQNPAVRGEGKAGYLKADREARNLSSYSNVPQPQGAIQAARRQDLAIQRKRNQIDCPLVSPEGALPPRGEVPELDRAVLAASGNCLAIRGDPHRADRVRLPG